MTKTDVRKDDLWRMIHKYYAASHAVSAAYAAQRDDVPLPLENIHQIASISDDAWRTLEQTLAKLTNEAPAITGPNSAVEKWSGRCRFCHGTTQAWAEVISYDENNSSEFKTVYFPCPSCQQEQVPYTISKGLTEWLGEDPYASEEWLKVPEGTMQLWIRYIEFLLRDVKLGTYLPKDLVEAIHDMADNYDSAYY